MSIYNYLNKDGKEASVSEIVEYVGLTQPTVSYHLKEMKHAGLLHSKKDGKEVFYSINRTCPHHNDRDCVLHDLKFPELEDVGS
jgi:DNA-binding transcriptional ArsR family regulator